MIRPPMIHAAMWCLRNRSSFNFRTTTEMDARRRDPVSSSRRSVADFVWLLPNDVAIHGLTGVRNRLRSFGCLRRPPDDNYLLIGAARSVCVRQAVEPVEHRGL